MGSLASLPWDVLLGEPGMVGSPVGEDEIGGLFQPPELRRNTGAARAAPSWKPSRVNRPPFLGRPIASMAGELTTRMICLVSAPSSERSVTGTPIPEHEWRARAVNIGKLSDQRFNIGESSSENPNCCTPCQSVISFRVRKSCKSLLVQAYGHLRDRRSFGANLRYLPLLLAAATTFQCLCTTI